MLRASTEACARFALLAAMLTAPAVLGAQSMNSALLADIAKMSRVAQSFNDAYGNFSDPSAIVYWWFSQLYNAQLDQTFPTNPILRVNPQNFNFFQLRKCARADVGKCLQYGNSSNGLPERLQGIWWQEGVVQPEQAISTAGKWDPVRRRLQINPTDFPTWAFEDSNSTRDKTGTFWLPSGAAHYNYFISNQFNVDVWFNEDITVGQIGGAFFGIDPLLLKWTSPLLLNWTMELNPNGSWRRRSAMIGIDSGLGQYNLRQIIDGNGNPGEAFDEWCKFNNGLPFFYGLKVWP